MLANDEDSLSYAAGAFHALPREATVDGLVEAFHTGIGLTYEMQGSAACHGTERMLGTATRCSASWPRKHRRPSPLMRS